MALLIASTTNFIELSLDAVLDFNSETDLVGFGMNKNAPSGLRVRKVTFVPSAAGDTLVVRDGQNGPRIFSAVNVLGTWDTLKDEYREDGHVDRGKLMSPYIHANECIITLAHLAFVIFEI